MGLSGQALWWAVSAHDCVLTLTHDCVVIRWQRFVLRGNNGSSRWGVLGVAPNPAGSSFTTGTHTLSPPATRYSHSLILTAHYSGRSLTDWKVLLSTCASPRPAKVTAHYWLLPTMGCSLIGVWRSRFTVQSKRSRTHY